MGHVANGHPLLVYTLLRFKYFGKKSPPGALVTMVE